MDRVELINKCRSVMVEHLESKGYPNMSRHAVLKELLPMWKKLDEHGLVEQVKALGCSFQQFQDLANRVAQEQSIMEQFEQVGNIFKKKKK
jgi:hypothetical protein